MSDKTKAVFEIWNQHLSDSKETHHPYKNKELFEQFSGVFALGPFYYYNLNFRSLSVDFANEKTAEVLGIPPNEFSMEALLDRIPDTELAALKSKEALVVDFFKNKISSEEIADYKALYFFRACNTAGTLKTFLHQVCPIKQTEDGAIEKVLGLDMDITATNLIKNDRVSFIGYGEKPSYYNINPTIIPYDYASINEPHSKLSELLSKRELEIVALLSKGCSSKEIAKKLFIAKETVSTHRKNILKKTGAKSTPELVSFYLLEELF